MIKYAAFALATLGCVTDAEPPTTDDIEQAESLDDYNHYPIDRQSYQLETRNLLDARRLAAFEYVTRAVEDKFPGFTLQSFKTYASFEYAFLFKGPTPISGNPSTASHRCVKLKAIVNLSPTDAFPRITRVKALPNVVGTGLCKDGTEI